MTYEQNFALLLAISLLTLTACHRETTNTVQPFTSETQYASCLTKYPSVISIQAGTAQIGSETGYREEAPTRSVQINAFDIDTTEVTNGQFKAFVTDTNYITDAEKVQAGFETPGGAVFQTPTSENPSWWQFIEGANWRHPEGPNSSILGRDYDPVVQVSLRDAKAYAAWAGRRLPSEAEWEYAAKAGASSTYIWGEDLTPDGKEQANTWQGAFPVDNTKADGYLRRAPVGCYTPNKYGLYDMIGNVWEWTDTPFSSRSKVPQNVIKGGSFLCAPNYCRRYRASALQPQDVDFTTNHIGFRTVSQRPTKPN